MFWSPKISLRENLAQQLIAEKIWEKYVNATKIVLSKNLSKDKNFTEQYIRNELKRLELKQHYHTSKENIKNTIPILYKNEIERINNIDDNEYISYFLKHKDEFNWNYSNCWLYHNSDPFITTSLSVAHIRKSADQKYWDGNRNWPGNSNISKKIKGLLSLLTPKKKRVPSFR